MSSQASDNPHKLKKAKKKDIAKYCAFCKHPIGGGHHSLADCEKFRNQLLGAPSTELEASNEQAAPLSVKSRTPDYCPLCGLRIEEPHSCPE